MLAGYRGDYPPTEPEAYRAYARQLLIPDIEECIGNTTPCSPIRAHRFPAQRRRYFEELACPPAGFLALGDAWITLDPLFGQGMTVVAKQAQLLARLVATGDLTPQRFYRQGAQIYRGPWMLSLAENLRDPLVSPLPWTIRLLHAYMDRIQRLTLVNSEVYDAYLRVVNLEEDPRVLFRPRVFWQAITSRAAAAPSAAIRGMSCTPVACVGCGPCPPQHVRGRTQRA